MSNAPMELLITARQTLKANPASTPHRRGSIALARIAIETTASQHPEFVGTRIDWRARFIALRTLTHPDHARKGYYLWSRCSNLIHYHPYRLIPDHTKIEHLLQQTQSWIETEQSHQVGYIR